MRLPLFVCAALSLTACVSPALSNDEIAGVDWHLVGLEGQEVGWEAFLRFDGDKVAGKAPCNRWFGTNSAALPAVSIQGIGATKMACPDLAAESAYFETLQAMLRAELDQGHLYLIGPEGRIMEFAKGPGEPCLSCLARQ
ncbi:META domain-containing protein [Tabrizicola sp.]|jgi:heat shock protein HslJ|uniref:META domain-containing protein n=1 Tax=Tabrizicola sp. TaxID=2005166 RepID=UPI0035AF6BE8